MEFSESSKKLAGLCQPQSESSLDQGWLLAWWTESTFILQPEVRQGQPDGRVLFPLMENMCPPAPPPSTGGTVDNRDFLGKSWSAEAPVLHCDREDLPGPVLRTGTCSRGGGDFNSPSIA